MKSRIIEHASVSPDALAANPRNWREHPPVQRAALRGILDEIGWVQSVIVNKRSNRIIDGHLRVDLARQNGEATVPVVYVDLSDAEERTMLLALDPIAELATPNRTAVMELLQGLSTPNAAVRDLLAQIASRYGERPHVPPEADVLPTDVEARVQRGDLWRLGRHRLVCGDATVAADVALACGGNTPTLMVTDPPYGVEYDPSWRSDNRVGPVPNDDRADWRAAYKLFPGDVLYAWHSALHVVDAASAIDAAGFDRRAQIIWMKPAHTFGRGAYHWQHEPCWYAVRHGKNAAWIGDRRQTTFWQIDHVHPTLGTKDDAETVHGAQKPVECMERPIRNHRGDVYDPFVGSGTTIIAAERADRTCYAMELDPGYADVAIARWEAFVGRTAERIAAAPAAV
jgi:DNA modification methylase